MNFAKIIFISALIFLSACGGNKDEQIATLENELAELREDMRIATSSATIAAIQKKQRDKAIQLLKELEEKRKSIWANLIKTTDEESCKELEAQIEELNNKGQKYAGENNISVFALMELFDKERGGGHCTEAGFERYEESVPQKDEDIIPESQPAEPGDPGGSY